MSGPVNWDTDTRTQIIDDMVLTIDPAGSTIEIQVDDDWYPAAWLEDPVEVTPGKKWTWTAQTTGYFAGPDVASPGSAVVLDTGRHLTQTRVTKGSDILVEDSTPIDVK